MHVVLVSTYQQPIALGMRYVSACLKRAGHTVTCLFLSSRGDPTESLPQSVLNSCVDLCRKADVVGISLMTNSFFRACHLTDHLRGAGIKAPVVWGGTHPTVAPEESAEFADYVCIGEGEKAMPAFVEALETGRDPGQTPGFAYERNGQLIRNQVFPLEDDFDSYPFPDYDLLEHWVLHKNTLVPAKPQLLGGTLRRYRLSSTRGCPFSCTFCNNATQLQIYKKAGHARLWVRKRSVESIIREIETMRSRFPSIEAVNIIDDLFLIRGEEEIREFVEAYRTRVNLPIEIDAFPNTITDAKIELLARLPIELISMGIQSGSQDTLRDLYNRPTRVETIAEAIRVLSSHKLNAEYHYLVSSPFETDESLLETLRFAASHHRGPAKLRLFPLQLFPGSAMYEKARQAGIIGERHEAAYRGVYRGKEHIRKARYLEIWLRIVLALRGVGVPPLLVHRLVDFAAHRHVRRCLDRPWFVPTAFGLYRIGHGLHKQLIHKPFGRPLALLRSYRRRKKAAARQRPIPPPGDNTHGEASKEHSSTERNLPRQEVEVADKSPV
jgi:radical SAM superfamily enzyme YgiQ (UPF0313 family)